MYKQAFKTYKEIFSIILIIAILLPIAAIYTDSSIDTFIATVFMAFYAHRNILTGEKLNFKSSFKISSNKDSNISLTFIWRFLVLTLGSLILAILPTIAVTLLILSNPSDTGHIMAVLTVFYAFIFGINLSLFGLVLPAASLKSKASFSSAIKRGKSKFLKTLWELIYGPLAITIFSAIVPMILVLPFISIADGTPFMNITEGTPSYKALEYVIEFTGALFSAFATVLVATILSQLYLETEESPQQA